MLIKKFTFTTYMRNNLTFQFPFSSSSLTSCSGIPSCPVRGFTSIFQVICLLLQTRLALVPYLERISRTSTSQQTDCPSCGPEDLPIAFQRSLASRRCWLAWVEHQRWPACDSDADSWTLHTLKPPLGLDGAWLWIRRRHLSCQRHLSYRRCHDRASQRR